MVIESSQHLLQHIDNGGSLSLDRHGQLQEQGRAGRFFQKIGDALLGLAEFGRAMIDERNNRLGNAMHAMVARDNPLPNLAREALPQWQGGLSSGGANMLARMEIGRQLVNFPPDTRPGVARALLHAYSHEHFILSATGIFQLIEEKAKELRTTPEGRLYTHNHAMIQKMETGNAEVTETIDRGKTKALDILGGLRGLGGQSTQRELNSYHFTLDMETTIALSRTEVTPQMLEDMAERIARETMVKILIRDCIDKSPEGAKLTPEEKTALLLDFMKFPQAEALLNASTPEEADDLAFIMRQNVALDLKTKPLLNASEDLALNMRQNVALDLKPEGSLQFNHAMIQKMNTGNAEVTEAIDRGKTKALDILGGLGGLGGFGRQSTLKELNSPHFTLNMETTIALSRTEVTPQMLEDMAERIARETLVKILIRDFIVHVHKGDKLAPEGRAALLRDFMEFPQAEALLNASTPEAAEDLASNMRRSVALDLQNDEICQSLKHELFNAGLEDFCAKTGLTAKEGKKLNTTSLENIMDSARKELDRSLLEAKPKNYHKANYSALKAIWEPMLKEFFDDRAGQYNYMVNMGASEADKEAWFRKS